MSSEADRAALAYAPAPPGRSRSLGRAVTAIVAVTASVTGVVLYATLTGGGGTSQFEVRDQLSGEVYYARPMELGETFTLQHIHSVTRRPVIETFSVLDAETVAIEEMWFDQPGPNLPTGPEQLGDGETTFIYEDDGSYRVVHHSYPIGSVPLLVGSESVNHTLTFTDSDDIRLLDIAERGTAVEFTIRSG